MFLNMRGMFFVSFKSVIDPSGDPILVDYRGFPVRLRVVQSNRYMCNLSLSQLGCFPCILFSQFYGLLRCNVIHWTFLSYIAGLFIIFHGIHGKPYIRPILVRGNRKYRGFENLGVF